MQIDWYTKAILTVIGLSPLGLLLRPVLMPEKVDAGQIVAVNIAEAGGWGLDSPVVKPLKVQIVE